MMSQTTQVDVSREDVASSAGMPYPMGICTGGRIEVPEIIELPPFIMEDEEWFFTEEHQASEAEANADIEAGRVATFDNVDDLIHDLRS